MQEKRAYHNILTFSIHSRTVPPICVYELWFLSLSESRSVSYSGLRTLSSCWKFQGRFGMLSAMVRNETGIAFLLLALLPAMAGAAGESSGVAADVETLRTSLEKASEVPAIPELVSRSRESLLETPQGREILNWARSAEREIPQTTQELYNRYREAGERFPYETPYFAKRERLTRAALAAWLEPDAGGLEHLCALLASVLDEPTWVLPAHERPVPWNIDLFSAETACELAHVLLLLEERLPDDLAGRIRIEIRVRVMDPFLEHAHEYWWNNGRNNWTGVCAGAVGQTFLLLEPDPERRARAASLVLEQMDRFLANGFEEDGACLEGIGYWGYGLLHCVAFGEMLQAKTGGAVDLLSHAKLRAIAQYPATAAIDKHVFASFADSHEHQSLTPFLAARLAQRTGVASLLPQTGALFDWRLTSVLRNLLWWDESAAGEPLIEDACLPASGIVKFVWQTGGGRAVLAAKAGHNAEPHNNNDVGSFVLRIGGATYLCDPGAGLYSREYFSSKRYENIFANSYGHSVPRIGRALQPSGGEYRGELSLPGPRQARIELTKAYKVEGLQEAVRVFSIQEGGALVMETRYAFEGAGFDVEEAFVTWLDVETNDSTARIRSGEGVLEIRAASGVFAAERLEEACKANRKSEVLTRLTLVQPAAAEIRNRYAFVYIPAK